MLGYIGIIGIVWGVYRDCRVYIRENGKEHGNYHFGFRV